MKISPSQVRRIVKKWRKRLAISPQWTINFKINENESDEDEEARDCIARISVEAGYYVADLVINAWQIETEDELDTAICHEIVHIILNPLFVIVRCALGDQYDAVGRDTLEAAVETITKGLLGATK